MYVSNRKRAYRVIRVYKRKPVVRLMNKHGVTFKTRKENLERYGYKFVKNKPAAFKR